MVALGHARVLEYQDGAYADLYVQRLLRVLAAERNAQAASAGTGGSTDENTGEPSWAVTRETARWLALWMAFDDIVRVAQLKLRPQRLQRVRQEVAARDDEIVKLYDHFKPGVSEFAALLPPRWAARLMAWEHGRRTRGHAAWALPLQLPTHSVWGALALRLLAGRRGLRRRGSRFAHEQALIERWLGAVERGLGAGWALGHETACCGRLIKGYGSTNEHGKETLLHIVDHLVSAPASAAARAAAVAAARQAALADDAGHALDAALRQHGAPARPLREQPVRWFKRRPAPLL